MTTSAEIQGVGTLPPPPPHLCHSETTPLCTRSMLKEAHCETLTVFIPDLNLVCLWDFGLWVSRSMCWKHFLLTTAECSFTVSFLGLMPLVLFREHQSKFQSLGRRVKARNYKLLIMKTFHHAKRDNHILGVNACC